MTMFGKPESFVMSHGLSPDNRWIKMSMLIPWEMIEEKYSKNFKDSSVGRPAKLARMAIGTLIIKEKCGLSDIDTVDMIMENPYMQFFIGLESFTKEAPMEASVITHFRKRVTSEMLAEINEYIIEEKTDDEDPPETPGKTGTTQEDTEGIENDGTLILDATCVPSDICFPTDVSLLNEGRKCLERIIDEQHEKGLTEGNKPRTYRKVAKKDYMRFTRNRRPTQKVIKKAIKAQLGYIRRNLANIDKHGIESLDPKSLEMHSVISKLYEQQSHMYDNNTHKVEDRIVSIGQPWVRPIVRGKATADVEFGAKVSVSVSGGYVRVEELSWDAYNEGKTLQDTVERYKERTGRYPRRVLADKIYRTRDNLNYCRDRGIHMNGPRLGRPPKDRELYEQLCRAERDEAGERNEVEGKFGTGKRCYGLGRLTSRLQCTCETQIHMIVLTMNLMKKMKSSFTQFLRLYYSAVLWQKKELFFHVL